MRISATAADAQLEGGEGYCPYVASASTQADEATRQCSTSRAGKITRLRQQLSVTDYPSLEQYGAGWPDDYVARVKAEGEKILAEIAVIEAE